MAQTTLSSPHLLLRPAKATDATALNAAFSDPEVMRYWSEPPHPSMARTRAWLNSMTSSPQNGITDFIICLKSEQSHQNAEDQSNESRDANDQQPIPIGKIGIYAPLPSNEIGFLIARPHWEKSLAREALSHVLCHLSSLSRTSPSAQSDTNTPDSSRTPPQQTNSSLGSPSYTNLTSAEQKESEYLYPSITADVDPRNTASIALLKKFGFVETGAIVERTAKIGGVWVESLYLRFEQETWLARGDKS